MRALLVEGAPGVGQSVASELTAAGVEVQRCRPADTTDFGCEGMPTGQGCPLEGAGTHVAVAVRVPEGGPMTHLEAGVGCALRLGVPVTVVGGGAGADYLPWVSSVADGPGDLMPAVETAARLGLAQLSDPARDVARRAVHSSATSGEEVAIEAHIDYAADRLRVDVQVAAPLDARTRQAIAVRVGGVVRPRARWARAVDIAVRSVDGPAPNP